jgi:hypothetical protein
MIHIRFLYHRAHGVLHGPICKLIVRMLVPDSLEVEKRTIHELLEKRKIPRVGYRLGAIIEMVLERGSKEVAFDAPIVIVGRGQLLRGASAFLPCQVADNRYSAGDACFVSSIGVNSCTDNFRSAR